MVQCGLLHAVGERLVEAGGCFCGMMLEINGLACHSSRHFGVSGMAFFCEGNP